jgi:hypothetical protein
MGWTMLPDGSAKLDVRAFIRDMEGELRRGPDAATRARILATLRRWQWDEMLDWPSRARARTLARDLDCVEALGTGRRLRSIT